MVQTDLANSTITTNRAYAQNYNTYLRMIKNYHAELAQKEEVAARERFQLKLARTEGFEYKNRRLLHFETWKQSPSIHHNFKGHAAAVDILLSDGQLDAFACATGGIFRGRCALDLAARDGAVREVPHQP